MNTRTQLQEAASRALDTPDAADVFKAYGMEIQPAAQWCDAFVTQLEGEAKAVGMDVGGREFMLRCVMGSLMTGVEVGRTGEKGAAPSARDQH